MCRTDATAAQAPERAGTRRQPATGKRDAVGTWVPMPGALAAASTAPVMPIHYDAFLRNRRRRV
jgi:hypothetical protein